MLMNREGAVNDVNALIPALGIKAELGISPEELRRAYAQKEELFRRDLKAGKLKDIIDQRKREKREVISPLWQVSDEVFWDESFPDSPHETLATSQLKVLEEETNVVFFFTADRRLGAMFVSPWKRIVQPERFREKSRELVSLLTDKHGSPWVKVDRAENLAWNEKKVYRWEDASGNVLQLMVYSKRGRPDGFELVVANEELRQRF